MSDVILSVASSADGFIADAEGGVGWLQEFEMDEGGAFETFMEGVGAAIMGSGTYEQMRGFGQWPYGAFPTHVLTSRDLDPPEGADVRFHDRPPADLVEELREDVDGTLWVVGGSQLASSFSREGLLDEIHTYVMPVLLGQGMGLVPDLEEHLALDLVESDEVGGGAVRLRYELPRG